MQITVPISEERSAKVFYCDLLGLNEIEKPVTLKGNGGFWLALNEESSIQLHIGLEEGIDRLKTKAHVAFEVSDIEFWRNKFSNAGIEVLQSKPIPGFERFDIRDPFGNRLEFMVRL